MIVEENAADFLLSTFGITPPAPEGTPAPADPDPVPPAVDPAPVIDPVPADPTPGEPTPAPAPAPATPEPIDLSKAESAFAAMRVENKHYKQTIDGMAKILGLEDKDPDKLIQAIEAKVLEAQSKQANIPVEILQRLNASEQAEQNRQAEARREATNKGFADVATQFKLDNSGIQEFAKSLDAMGINPYTMDIDLPALYILQHHDALLENARREGELREAERLSKVHNFSTQPNPNTGKAPGTTGPINTTKGLDDFFKSL